MTKKLAAIGECMVEMAPTGDTATYRMGFAGDTLNTAWYLRRAMGAEWDIDYVTAVGTDATSDAMVGFLASSGLGTGRIQRRANRTVGLYMIELQDGERHFSYWRGQSAAKTLADDQTELTACLDGADVIFFSGITVAILPPAARDTLFHVLRAKRQNGATVVFDPNLRPKLWADGTEMCAAIMRAAAESDIVLPSFEDEAEWFGDASLAATADRYRAVGCGTIIVKNGGGSMLIVEGDKSHAVSPQTVTNVVDTTAAGDSFNAGFLAFYLTGSNAADSAMAGAHLAAQVIQNRGALVKEALLPAK